MKFYLASLMLMTGMVAQAKPVHFKNCKSSIITEVFKSCPDGEGGSHTICESKQTFWGTVLADLTVDSQKRSASALLSYKSRSGKVTRSNARCILGSDQWMDCTTITPISELGRLTISFNINGIGPEVYFASIFADKINVPVGGFHNTERACQKL